MWAKIKNDFQHPGVHPKNTHSLLFYNQRVQQLWQEAVRRKAVPQVGQSQAISGWTSQKQYLTIWQKKKEGSSGPPAPSNLLIQSHSLGLSKYYCPVAFYQSESCRTCYIRQMVISYG